MTPPNLHNLCGHRPSAATPDLLAAAVQHWEDNSTSASYIQAVLAQETDLDGLISACRDYFYKSDAAMALKMAIALCDRLQKIELWPAAWPQFKPILQTQLTSPRVRLYLKAYLAAGLLQARLGNLAIAHTMGEHAQFTSIPDRKLPHDDIANPRCYSNCPRFFGRRFRNSDGRSRVLCGLVQP
ncbi:MAG: hypothetical protein ACFBSG_03620 [Leptolyngbyaceae cyanobacterium]